MKISTIIILLFSITVLGQNSNVEFFSNKDEISSYEDSQSDQVTADEPGPDLPTRAPINDYLPLLAVAAVGLGFYYRKELNQTIKSN